MTTYRLLKYSSISSYASLQLYQAFLSDTQPELSLFTLTYVTIIRMTQIPGVFFITDIIQFPPSGKQGTLRRNTGSGTPLHGVFSPRRFFWFGLVHFLLLHELGQRVGFLILHHTWFFARGWVGDYDFWFMGGCSCLPLRLCFQG